MLLKHLFASARPCKVHKKIVTVECSKVLVLGVINLVLMQKFPKKQHLLPPDTRTYVCVSGGKKC